MTSPIEQDAEALRKVLVQSLMDSSALTDPQWQEAFEAVPRHVFVPYFYRQGPDGQQQRISGDDPGRTAEWLSAVYDNQPLVTHLIKGNTASSSSQPSVMAVMLEALQVERGMRVLEIGAGTGYNAALLSHRLGSDNVVTVDVDTDVTAAARERLGLAGYWPTVITGDGALEHHPAELNRKNPRPYGRIIATCGITKVPQAWLRQLSTGGIILAPLGDGLVRLQRISSTEAAGRFISHPAYFMPLRADGDSGIIRRPPLPEGEARPSTVPADAIVDSDFRFLLSVALPGLGWQYDLEGGSPTGARVWAADGSIANLRDDGTVVEAGPSKIWAVLESAYRVFQLHDRPTRDRFGISIRDREQRVWLDKPNGQSWQLSA